MSSARDRTDPSDATGPAVDAREPVLLLQRDLRTGPGGLSDREAARRLQVVGPNELSARRRRQWPMDLTRQLTHPLALLLWMAAGLALVAAATNLAIAILAVVLLNAAVAMIQERQAERAVEALGRYLPQRAAVLRDGTARNVLTAELVPGDLLLLQEGQRIPADARLLRGAVEVDASALTGESVPVERSADAVDNAERRLDSPVLVFSGTACVAGSATALVHATGRHTEIGRIAALSARVGPGDSPLERQVRRVAWLIAAVAAGAAAAFLPLGLLAGLSLAEAFLFAIGLLVANVPEGLLPTITLALAAGARTMARRGALVKRLSAVETLGSTTTICTDKTGTLTVNRMRVAQAWAAEGSDLTSDGDLAAAAARCTSATLAAGEGHADSGDPTELALLAHADRLGVGIPAARRDAERLRLFAFDPKRRRMGTVDQVGDALIVHVKGAPEDVLPRCSGMSGAARAGALSLVDDMADRGLRVLAVARRSWPVGSLPDRDHAESDLGLVGLVGLIDPPRPEVAAAVTACHTAGIRVHVVTGDNGRTAAEIARAVGIGADRVVDGPALDAMPDAELDALLTSGQEVVFARAAPEAKLRIADALRHCGEVVAMTGDGVNDAPALRCADIGVAMGLSGTEVAREAATLVLTDDNFATIVTGVQEGRRVYDNVRKFMLYIFAHAVPEMLPFLVFALAGGAVPLPLTVLQILAIDLGTETLPALALGREPAEPGLMSRPPRRRENVIDRRLLLRAWGIMGLVAAGLVLAAFFAVLLHAGWHAGADVSDGSPLHAAYLQATTASFAGIVACQLGAAVASRAEHASLASIGFLSNRLLLGSMAFEVVFAAAVIYLPAPQSIFGTAGLPAWVILMMLPFPVLVWAADEVYRWAGRRRRNRHDAAGMAPKP